jgi:hypothetical protein
MAEGTRWVALAVVEETAGAFRVLHLERVEKADADVAGQRIGKQYAGRFDRIYGAWSSEELVMTLPAALGARPLFALSGGGCLPSREQASPHLRELLDAGRLWFDVGEEIERDFRRQLEPGEDDLDAMAHDELLVAVACASGLVQSEW